MAGIWHKKWLISQKLSFIILLTTSVALVMALTAILANDFYIYQREQKRKLLVLAEVIGNSVQASVVFADVTSAETTLSALRAEKHLVFAAIYGADGSLFAFYQSPDAEGVIPNTLNEASAAFMNNKNFTSRMPIVLNDRHLGTLYMESDKEELRAMLLYYLKVAAAILLLSLAAAFGIALQLQQMIAAPIIRLTELAQKVSRDRDYNVRAHKETDDELGVLIDNFNQMLSEIQARENTLKEIARKLSDSNLELAQSNKDLEQFAYIASHDLQEPLRKIIAFSDRLKLEASTLTDAEKADSLLRMHNAGYRMKQVIEDLLQFSKASRRDIVYEKIDLKSIVEEVLSDLELSITKAQAQIHIEALPEIYANKPQMRHLFQNLITNAIKFSKKNTPPEITISSAPAAEGFAEIIVSDNGIGFDEKYAEKIFKPFQRLHGKDDYEGTGIGLAIVDKIIHNHGGKIRAKSRPGAGASFEITFPLGPHQEFAGLERF